jgi:O-antigen/teichoic acid export membrane protein
LLTTEQFGLFNVYKSWLSIISIFATLSLHGGVFNNGMVKFEKDRDKFTSSMQGLSSTITVALFFVYLMFKNFWNSIFELPTFLIIILFTEILFSEALKLWSAKKRYAYKYKNLIIVTLSMSLLNPIVGIIAVILTDNKGISRIVSFAFVQISISIIIYIFNFVKGGNFFDKNYWRFAFLFNIPLIPHYLSGTILSQADRIMINTFNDPSQVGIYSVAYSGSMIINIIQSSINKSLIPWTYKKIKNEQYDRLREITKNILVLIGSMVILLILFAPEAIMILAPKEYHEGIWVVPPVALSVYFIFIYTLFANVEFYFEENKFIMIASIIAAVFNIILNYIFLPIFGYVAAGYTTLFSYMLYSFSHFVFMNKILNKHIKIKDIYNYKFMFLLSLFLLITSSLILTLYNYLFIRYIIILFVLLIGYLNRFKIIKVYSEIK